MNIWINNQGNWINLKWFHFELDTLIQEIKSIPRSHNSLASNSRAEGLKHETLTNQVLKQSWLVMDWANVGRFFFYEVSR